MSHLVFTPREHARARGLWLFLGIVIGLVLAAVLVVAKGWQRQGEIVVERRTETETVLRLPSQVVGFSRPCILVVNHKLRTWQLTC